MIGLVAGYVNGWDDDSDIGDAVVIGLLAAGVTAVLGAVAAVFNPGVAAYTATLHGALFGEMIADMMPSALSGWMLTGVTVGTYAFLDAVIPGYYGAKAIRYVDTEYNL